MIREIYLQVAFQLDDYECIEHGFNISPTTKKIRAKSLYPSIWKEKNIQPKFSVVL
jgi:hypothetical protein